MTENYIINNPFFKYDMDKLCLICNKRLFKEYRSIYDELTITSAETQIKAIEFLQLFSHFTYLDVSKGPPKMCPTCFSNTLSAYKFQLICNKSFTHIQNYITHQENMKHENTISLLENAAENIIIEVLPVDENEITEPVEEHTIKSETPEETNAIVDLKRKRYASMYRPVECKVCHKILKAHYISVHMRIHTGVKPYMCKFCQKRFVQPTELKKHLLNHSDEKPHLCSYCGKGFKNIQIFKGHLRTHTGERPYPCKICGKTFGSTNVRKDHYLVHTGERSFKCEVCGKAFGRRTNLNTHLKSHSGVKEHECHICGNRFTQAHSLRSHLKRHTEGNL